MGTFVVHYKIKPEKAPEHEQAIARVFEYLQAESPAGIRCLVLKLGDGSYIHIAVIQDGALLASALECFPLFQITTVERCVERCLERPQAGDVAIFRDYGILEEVGRIRWISEGAGFTKMN